MNEARSLRRNSTASATSFGVPMRRNGVICEVGQIVFSSLGLDGSGGDAVHALRFHQLVREERLGL
jgi:hypothetical protein